MSVRAGVPAVGEDQDELPVRRRRRWPRVLVGLAGLLLLALLALWLARKPLATHYADRFLAEKGVAARYGIADLGLGRQRLTNVVLGDPADPDLVADWLEARTAVGLGGPYLTGVRGGHVRVRARWVNSKLSFGSLDRLLPAGESGKPFTLPALALDVDDLRARVETPWGVLGAKLTGSGRLDGGFAGKLAVTSLRLGAACAATGPHLAVEVRTLAAGLTRRAQAVQLEGSAETAGLTCAGVRSGYANASGRGQIVLGNAISWTLDTDITGTQVRRLAWSAQGITGRVRLAGLAGRIAGDVALAGTRVAGSGMSAATVRLTGQVLRDSARRTPFAYTGQAAWTGATVQGVDLRRAAATGEGTPLAPLLRRAASGAATALRRFDGEAAIYLASTPAGVNAQVSRLAARSASGARLSFGGGNASWSAAGASVVGTAQLTGGGLPTATVRFTPAGSGAFRGTASVAPYTVDGARLALSPVRFAIQGAGGSVTTMATLSGPLADGRVEGLTVPIDARWSASGVSLGPDCTAVGWQRVAVAGLTLDPGGVRLCPTGPALVDLRGGRVAGGATLGTARLTGRLGTTPLTLAAAGARLSLGERGFTLSDVAARLGRPERITRLDVASLDGRVTPAGLTGRFAGAGGRIGAVPLLLSEAAGDWRLARGALTLGGAMTVSDAQAERPRFKPLPLREVALTLARNRVDATGKLRAPGPESGGARPVADLRLTHDLARGTGNARFTVPGLVFDKDLQPEQLTPVTFGVIAEVRGTVTGEGAIDWTPAGVTSTGAFATTGTDLAAAFGPVQGIAGTIRFTDLLALESAPGQQLAVRSVNPGIAVTDGVVRFQTLREARVQVEGARWPFAGGTLTLDPSLLVFGEAAQRRLVFRVAGMAADQFLQQFDFKNLDATGVFDGVLPMVFDQGGGRIEDGRLQVRPGGGTIAYVGPITQKDIGFWPNLAFQALKSLRYRSLAIVMNGPLAGEMVTQVRFAGVSQGEGAQRGGIAGLLVGRLQRLPFLFNIRIEAPFRGLLDATASFYDPRRLIQRNLPQLLDEQNKRNPPPPGGTQASPIAPAPIQPPASEIVP